MNGKLALFYDSNDGNDANSNDTNVHQTSMDKPITTTIDGTNGMNVTNVTNDLNLAIIITRILQHRSYFFQAEVFFIRNSILFKIKYNHARNKLSASTHLILLVSSVIVAKSFSNYHA